MTWVSLTSVGRSHSFQLAEALEDLGLLREFHTGLVLPDRAAATRIKRFLSPGDTLRLAKRATRVSPERLRPTSTAEFFEQGARRLFRRWDLRTWNYAASAYFDWVVARRIRRRPVPVVHAFEHSALRTFQAARASGAVTVLEQPIIHIDRYLELERLVRDRTVRTPLARAPGWASHIERKRKEYALADYCFVGLPSARETMIEGGFPADRVFVTPYGVPTGWETSATAPRSLKDPLRVLFVGHVDFYKGLDVLLDAWELLPNARFELTVLGVVDRAWEKYFIERFAKLDRVSYQQPVPSSQMPAVYASHDVLAFPSLVGGVGFAVCEALASGLVVVLSNSEGLLTDQTDCLVADVDSPQDWADTLARLQSRPELFQTLSANGIARARTFASDQYVSAVRDAYTQIAERENLTGMHSVLLQGC